MAVSEETVFNFQTRIIVGCLLLTLVRCSRQVLGVFVIVIRTMLFQSLGENDFLSNGQDQRMFAHIVPVHLRAHHTVCLYSVPTKDTTVKSGTENVLRKIAAIRKEKKRFLFCFGQKNGIQFRCFCCWVSFFFFFGGGGGGG